MAAEIGQMAPDFTMTDQRRNPVSRDDLLGRKTLLVFIPFAFSGVCTGEVCSLRDDVSSLSDLDANVVIVTTDTFFTNAAWAEKENLDFTILSDFWPHGAVSQAYGTFNDAVGVSMRSTYVLDEQGIVREIIASDELGVARNHDAYAGALAAI